MMKPTLIFNSVALALLTNSAMAIEIDSPAISVVLDGYYQDGERALGHREDGFGLGETELALSGSVDDMFFGKLTAVIATEDDSTETELEEAFVQTLSMPFGLSIRAGRFMSDIGYLNNQHLHSDSFAERPVAYRAMLGGHYYDDGLRLNWVAPTDLYWTLGAELFSGDPLEGEGVEDPDSVGTYHLYTKLGGDFNVSHSWQLGFSYLHNANGEAHHEEHEHEEDGHEDEHGDEEAHGHSHNASLTGNDLYAIDATYKWAPNGNYKNNYLTVSGEYLYLDGRYAEDGDEIDQDAYGWYLSSVYQITPNWSAGIRYGELDASMLHEEEHEGEHELHSDSGKVKETDVMLAWHYSHFSTVRLQYSNIDDELFGSKDDNIVTLQFVMALGAHGAHQF